VGDRENEITEARRYIEKAGYTVLEGEIPERTAYRRASDDGRALSETSHPSLRLRAERLAQSIIDFVSTNQKGRKRNADANATAASNRR
jgi:chromosome partitioning protein